MRAMPTAVALLLGLVVGICGAASRAAADDVALMKGGSTYVPVRALAALAGASVTFSKGLITAKGAGTTVSLRVGKRAATVNGKSVKLSAAPFVLSGTTYVPLRFATGAFGASTQYDPSGPSVTVSRNGNSTWLQVETPSEYQLAHQTSLTGFMRLLERAFASLDKPALRRACTGNLRYYGQYLSDGALDRELARLVKGCRLKFNPPGLVTDDYEDGSAAAGDYYSIAYDGSRPLEGGEDGFLGNFIFHKPDRYWRVASVTGP